jgi:hypothetical protein
MHMTHRFRHGMLVRLLKALGIAALPLPALVAGACGGRVVVDGLGSGAGGSGVLPPISECELLSMPIFESGMEKFSQCITRPVDGCPSQEQIFSKIAGLLDGCSDLESVDCGPVESVSQCCYTVSAKVVCVDGRPFMVDGVARTAAAVRVDRGWGSPGELMAEMAEAEVAHLSPSVREALAQAWEADGLFEHASIATFARVSLELLGVGAPADLVAAAHEAALDEIRHARLCLMLAQRYRGEPVAPGPFPFGGAVALRDDLTSLAVAAAREGCIGETIAATLAGDQLASATDPLVKRALETIAEDESRHAELAWRTVAWAMERGGEEVRAAVAAVFAQAELYLPAPSPSPEVPADVLAAHGRLAAAAIPAACVRTLNEVIRPCAEALLRRSPPSRSSLELSSISAA